MIVEIVGLGIILFLIGIWGVILNRKSIILMLINIELMLLAVNMNFIIFSIILDDMIGQILSLFVMTVGAGEASIGLAIIVTYYRIRGTIGIMYINLLRG